MMPDTVAAARLVVIVGALGSGATGTLPGTDGPPVTGGASSVRWA